LGTKKCLKKKGGALYLKTDSSVVEGNVHFPTDYNLLWDSSRKALDIIKRFKKKDPLLQGWRKPYDWFKSLKNLSRSMGKISAPEGKNKETRVKDITQKYLTKAILFRDKLEKSKATLPIRTAVDLLNLMELERFISLINKHIDLIDRRLLKGGKIPHREKLFSIFEQYTEWITKGKQRPNIELGKGLSITTDQYGLLVDGYIMEKGSDSQIVLSTANRLSVKYSIAAWSFDKGYWHKDNKEMLKEAVEQVIMPKKGKRNKVETKEEKEPAFKKSRNRHSAVESNINELEHCGLDRCPDKGFHGFKRYVGIAIVAYNLKRTGRELLKQEREKIKRKDKRRKLKKAA